MNINQIDRAAELLTLLTEEFTGKLKGRMYGPLPALETAARTGGFIHPDTDDASRLRSSSAQLRKIANEIDARCDALEANERVSYHLQAAE